MLKRRHLIAGAGSPPHFLGALLGKAAGLDLRHMPCRDSAPGIQDLLDGQVPAMTSPIGDYPVYLKDGKLRLLDTSGTTRSRFAPDVPTYTEQGFKDLVLSEYYEFFMPGRTPPDVVEAFAKLGLEAMANTPAEPAQMVREENAQWGPVVKRAGFTPEN